MDIRFGTQNVRSPYKAGALGLDTIPLTIKLRSCYTGTVDNTCSFGVVIAIAACLAGKTGTPTIPAKVCPTTSFATGNVVPAATAAWGVDCGENGP